MTLLVLISILLIYSILLAVQYYIYKLIKSNDILVERVEKLERRKV